MAPREFVLLVHESAYKTPVGSPVLGTSSLYLRLAESNALTMRPKPIHVPVQRGGGQTNRAYTKATRQECTGTLKVILCYSQAAFLLGWAATPINSLQTLPYVTTEPVGDLASMAVYHAITTADGTIKRRVYLGTKVEGWNIACTGEAPLAVLTLNLRASTPQGNQFDSSVDPTAVTFPPPSDTNFPIDPLLFTDLNGFVTVGTSRTQFDAITLDSKHTMDPKFFENRYLNVHRFWGRDTTIELTNYYKISPDDRTVFEGVTPETVTAEWSGGTHTVVFTMNAQNVFNKVDDDLSLEKCYMQNLGIDNQWDPTAAGDIGFTVT
jgi:hypothetical protein